jgi:hypothetical protein
MNTNDVERFKATIKKEANLLEKKLSKETGIEVYVQAIYMGYLDASRTFNGQRKVRKEDDEVKNIAKSMKKFVDGSSDNFDDTFYGACKELCDTYEMKFGQAQKIMNMAFKYLFCIADNEMIKKRFNMCHMPLDGIMLEWVHRNIKDEEKKKLQKVDAWSEMAEGSEDEPCTYRYYKKYIDIYCQENKTTPLLLDFENWVRMYQFIAAENYKKAFTDDELSQKKHIKLLVIAKRLRTKQLLYNGISRIRLLCYRFLKLKNI